MNSDIQQLAETRRRITEERVASALATGVLDGSAEFGRYATWLLAATGATGVATVANYEALDKLVGGGTLKVAGIFLVLSGVLGFAAKSREQLVSAHTQGRESFAKHAEPVLTEHDRDISKIESIARQDGAGRSGSINDARVMHLFQAYFPRPIQWHIRRRLSHLAQSPEAGIKDALRSFVLLVTYTNLQAAALMAFYLVALVLGTGI